ncbi:MAG: hypothetical protein VKJ44_07545 [Synechococcus sp.]|nr:hypothetical protein [Synechococcus sp.]
MAWSIAEAGGVASSIAAPRRSRFISSIGLGESRIEPPLGLPAPPSYTWRSIGVVPKVWP